MNKSWYQQSQDTVIETLNSHSLKGLDGDVATQLLETYGENRLEEAERKKLSTLILDQLKETMVIILIIAALISGGLGDVTEMFAILVIVCLFVTLGFTQEYRAEKAMSALKKMAVPKVRVIRDGKEQEIVSIDLVPGDIMLLETGNMIAADARIIETVNLRTQESMLTGEVESVEKVANTVSEENAAVADRKNMLYMGTIVTYGRGKAIVVETGMTTELGKIANRLNSVENQITPLQKQLSKVGKQLALAGIIAALVIMIIGYFSGASFETLLLTAVSVAVAVIPEGLPAVVTITLALGAQKMLKRHALIRKLPAVETLGSVNIICSDKTGTLTENKMTVTSVHLWDNTVLDIAKGQQKSEEKALYSLATELLLLSGVLCSDAKFSHEAGANHQDTFLGDPTEGALLVLAKNLGYDVPDIQKSCERVLEIPFDSVRKCMSSLNHVARLKKQNISSYVAFCKGSVDTVLENSTYIETENGKQPLTQKDREAILEKNTELASQGIRVMSFAYKLQEASNTLEESNLVFLGLVAMVDPPRKEVRAAIQVCKTAQIRPIMITGDHPLTAQYIAKELGIDATDGVLTGKMIDRLNEREFKEKIQTVSVFARVSPEHKIKIIEALQSQGNVVSMTGDGVNDSPALKKADIGVAMGITGTDVSKEASDMILLDDNFTTIVASIEEGRTIFDNIKRFIAFSLAGNIGKVLVMLAAPLLALIGKTSIAISLLPLQLLWLNLLTDGLLGLGLGVESAEKGVMQREPNSLKKSIFSGKLGKRTVTLGIIIGLLATILAGIYVKLGSDKWQTILFTVLAFLQIAQAISARTLENSVFEKKFFSNLVLNLMIAITVLLQILVIYSPLSGLFHIVSLSLVDWMVIIVTSLIFFAVAELEKQVKY